jgi:hypothetical protein
MWSEHAREAGGWEFCLSRSPLDLTRVLAYREHRCIP